METATAKAAPLDVNARWAILLAYLAAVVVAESLIAIPGNVSATDRPFQSIGLGIHILLVFTLMFASVMIESRDAAMGPLLVATSLASLVRVFSLAVPRYEFVSRPPTNVLNTIPWLALVSVPLLLSVVAVAYVQKLRPRDLGLVFARWQEFPIQALIAITGIPLGLLEFEILSPEPWIANLAPSSLLVGAFVIFLATGLSEELIFRGILLKRAVGSLGEGYGLLYVTAIFASLHIFFLQAADLGFVFLVGLFYGYAVLKTKNLWGVILSHSLGNVVLYLVAPHVL